MPIGKHRHPALPVPRVEHAVDAGGPELGLDIGDEIGAVFLGLEADQVVGEHGGDQLAMLRQRDDRRAIGPRRVQEESDRLPDVELAQLFAEAEEMIVLHPEARIRLGEAQQRARHVAVDLAVGRIVRLAALQEIDARMQRRPQRGVRIAFVVVGVVRLRQIDGGERAAAQRLDRGQRVAILRLLELTARADPHRAEALDGGEEGGGKASHHRFARGHARDSVGHYNDCHEGSRDPAWHQRCTAANVPHTRRARDNSFTIARVPSQQSSDGTRRLQRSW